MKLIFLVLILFSSPLCLGLINAKPLQDTPDLVRLVFTNKWVCSGVFLNSTTILTAAHCVTPEKEEDSIFLDQILSANDTRLEVSQFNIYIHPKSKFLFNSHDIAIIKTSENKHFAGNFKLETENLGIRGHAILFGCGKSDLKKNIRTRSTGENNFLRVGPILFFLGRSENSNSEPGIETSIAPNDSGAPIVEKLTGNIIGIAFTTTTKESAQYGLPVISTGASTVEKSNLDFINEHLN